MKMIVAVVVGASELFDGQIDLDSCTVDRARYSDDAGIESELLIKSTISLLGRRQCDVLSVLINSGEQSEWAAAGGAGWA